MSRDSQVFLRIFTSRKIECNALITTGRGRFFSNGIDIKNMSRDDAHLLLNEFQTILFHLMELPFPTIACINGHAFGGGFLFSVAHDFRFMNSDRGWVCIPAVALGIKLPDLIIQLLGAKLGAINQQEMLLMGQRYTASQALEMKLVSRISTTDQLIPNAVTFIKTQLPKNNLAYKQMRLSIFSTLQSSIKSNL